MQYLEKYSVSLNILGTAERSNHFSIVRRQMIMEDPRWRERRLQRLRSTSDAFVRQLDTPPSLIKKRQPKVYHPCLSNQFQIANFLSTLLTKLSIWPSENTNDWCHQKSRQIDRCTIFLRCLEQNVALLSPLTIFSPIILQ